MMSGVCGLVSFRASRLFSVRNASAALTFALALFAMPAAAHGEEIIPWFLAVLGGGGALLGLLVVLPMRCGSMQKVWSIFGVLGATALSLVIGLQSSSFFLFLVLPLATPIAVGLGFHVLFRRSSAGEAQ
jgi:hypothetical protein